MLDPGERLIVQTERVSGCIDVRAQRGIGPAGERNYLPQRLAGTEIQVAIEDRRIAAGEREADCLRGPGEIGDLEIGVAGVPGPERRADVQSRDGDVLGGFEDGVHDDSGGDGVRYGAVRDRSARCPTPRAAATRPHPRRLRTALSTRSQ